MFGFTILNLPRNMKRMEDISRVYSRAELNSMSKEELIEIILKSQPHEELEIREQKKKKQKVESSQELDWSKYSQRHIALKFSYLVSSERITFLFLSQTSGMGISWLGNFTEQCEFTRALSIC